MHMWFKYPQSLAAEHNRVEAAARAAEQALAERDCRLVDAAEHCRRLENAHAAALAQADQSLLDIQAREA